MFQISTRRPAAKEFITVSVTGSYFNSLHCTHFWVEVWWQKQLRQHLNDALVACRHRMLSFFFTLVSPTSDVTVLKGLTLNALQFQYQTVHQWILDDKSNICPSHYSVAYILKKNFVHSNSSHFGRLCSFGRAYSSLNVAR